MMTREEYDVFVVGWKQDPAFELLSYRKIQKEIKLSATVLERPT